MTEQAVYVYGLWDPLTALCRYVGISNDPWSRYRYHLNFSSSYRVANWISNLSSIQKQPELRVICKCDSRKDALKIEAEWIQTLALSNSLLNMRENPLHVVVKQKTNSYRGALTDPIPIRFYFDDLSWLQEESTRRDRSVAWLVREAIRYMRLPVENKFE